MNSPYFGGTYAIRWTMTQKKKKKRHTQGTGRAEPERKRERGGLFFDMSATHQAARSEQARSGLSAILQRKESKEFHQLCQHFLLYPHSFVVPSCTLPCKANNKVTTQNNNQVGTKRCNFHGHGLLPASATTHYAQVPSPSSSGLCEHQISQMPYGVLKEHKRSLN